MTVKRALSPRYLLLPLAISAGVAALFLILDAAGADLPALVTDPLVAANAQRVWLGLLSQAMVLTWALSAGLLLAAGIVSKQAGLGSGRAAMAFTGGALFLSLGLDDAIKLHEELAPKHLGISERASKGFWVLLAPAWVIAFRRQLLAGRPELLLTVGALFVGSLAIDSFFEGNYAPEEALKFAGLLILVAWSVHECRRATADALRSARAS